MIEKFGLFLGGLTAGAILAMFAELFPVAARYLVSTEMAGSVGTFTRLVIGSSYYAIWIVALGVWLSAVIYARYAFFMHDEE
ncbi:hypothetical protein K3X44_11445 [Aliiroseovarius crassostreae]|uniref:hypothetical protein n=1 Tax=Aliiroseovarius crassostreae TaxID=154981 RepID=UPI002201DF12|nr:hypothetical protein [Aliiroseovarius crassostreae]UWQ01104.1 hypothetical protein K3X44_11445 [Aliiroseovarius crassostreae]